MLEKLNDYFTKERIENTSVGMFIFGCIGVLYSIIAGIWGFAPIKNINWKIFGTSIIIAVIGIIIAHVNDDTN